MGHTGCTERHLNHNRRKDVPIFKVETECEDFQVAVLMNWDIYKK